MVEGIKTGQIAPPKDMTKELEKPAEYSGKEVKADQPEGKKTSYVEDLEGSVIGKAAEVAGILDKVGFEGTKGVEKLQDALQLTENGDAKAAMEAAKAAENHLGNVKSSFEKMDKAKKEGDVATQVQAGIEIASEGIELATKLYEVCKNIYSAGKKIAASDDFKLVKSKVSSFITKAKSFFGKKSNKA